MTVNGVKGRYFALFHRTGHCHSKCRA